MTVMDAVGSERGGARRQRTVGSPIAMLFAATCSRNGRRARHRQRDRPVCSRSRLRGYRRRRASTISRRDFRATWGTEALSTCSHRSHERRRAFRRWFARSDGSAIRRQWPTAVYRRGQLAVRCPRNRFRSSRHRRWCCSEPICERGRRRPVIQPVPCGITSRCSLRRSCWRGSRCRTRATRRRCSTRSRSSSRAIAGSHRDHRGARAQCCSPTSSARPSKPSRSATAAGENNSTSTTRWCVRNSTRFGGREVSTPETASSQCSTVRRSGCCAHAIIERRKDARYRHTCRCAHGRVRDPR